MILFFKMYCFVCYANAYMEKEMKLSTHDTYVVINKTRKLDVTLFLPFSP